MKSQSKKKGPKGRKREKESNELIAQEEDLIESVGVPLLTFLELEGEAGDSFKSNRNVDQLESFIEGERGDWDSLIGTLLVDVLEDHRKSVLRDVIDAKGHTHAALLKGDVKSGETVGVCRRTNKGRRSDFETEGRRRKNDGPW